MSAVEARAWAVRQGDKLLVDTVSPTRRAAMANWLHFHAPMNVYADTSDAVLEGEWETLSHGRGACLVEVTVREG